ncbi:tRNA epoxyqueuosine(34) reductase QueG [Methylocystis iwaonis]|uniref:Epoxyqueuosine reductase n=1 Tax=Methylocystis iwaonis TaxID=2885079 RepID=A0ABN6VEK2_9HYPH|nr:tRNA epoxyqueuosine(34) reductase QueG [Methylocystis iwaonis]BDV33640.1 epoxyqueuosine reductase [Methylocystis iwaonis]
MTTESAIRAHALSLGFDACRFTTAEADPLLAERLRAWLESGAHGDMGWMAETADRRVSPKALWPEAKSVVMLGLNYGPSVDSLAALANREAGAISVYARHRDYHDIVKGRLKQLAAFMLKRAGGGDVKVFVDTAPVMEKPLAQQAGLGWQGKHTNLVSRDFGSWLFLGAIFTDLALTPDAPERDHCGSCRNCLDACPTGAFTGPYQLDARRCVSYLTIEHKGPIPHALREAIGNRIYGCDDCLAACPWNKFARVAREAKLAARPDLESPALAELAQLDDAGFRALFSGSPIKRIGRARFIRNVLIAIGNSGAAALAIRAERLLADPDSLVRGAAVWALAKLAPQRLVALRQLYASERDESVRDEWAKVTHFGKK